MLRFGRVGVDIARRVVELDGEPQHLEPQAFDLLAFLITHRDRVVPKPELLDEVWGDQFVSEAALTTRVKEVRRAVGDDGTRQEVVRNYRGRGYRFVAHPAEPGGDPRTGAASDGLRGRDAEAAEVAALLDRATVVTLTGPGGVGKTALALDVARRRAHRHRGGVIVVPLAAVREAAEVPHVIRRAADLLETGPTESELVAAIAELDALVVLDNCEHVIDEVARLVAAVAAASSGTRVLATSRERLGIPAEQVKPLQPIDLVSARELLVDRVRSIQPGWVAPDDRIDQLVELVDRLPLAIEMAAGHLSSVGIDELVALLDDRLDLLRSSSRGVEPRHSTLSALVDWSEQLLDEGAWQLLADLSVFAGPVTAADVAAVTGAEQAALLVGPLSDLIEHSLVVADTTRSPTRYHLLDTVRACVAPRRAGKVDEQHAEHIAQVVRASDQALRTPAEPEAAAQLDSLTAEIRAAHRWARGSHVERAADITASLLHYAHERQWSEPAVWAEQLLSVAGERGVVVTAAAASLAADASNRGDYERARELATLALESDSPVVVAFAHDTLLNVGLYTGQVEHARAHGTALLELASRTHDPLMWTLGLLGRALAHLYTGEVGVARGVLDESSPPAPLSPTCAAWLAYADGEVTAAEGNAVRAIALFDAAIELGTSVGSEFVASVSRVSQLAARSTIGDEAALDAFGPVLDHYRRVRSLTHGITALRNLIVLLVRQGRDEPAAVLLGALSHPDIKSTYGAESELLADARRSISDRNPPDAVTEWTRRGAAEDPIWALDYAIALVGANVAASDA